jgi:predicted short-subunit dehydrogenase-like oxidoreductase (DUF2520 family)
MRVERRRPVTSPGRFPKSPEFDLLLVAVPDTQVTAVAESWADRVRWEGRVALHTSGVLGTSPLRSLGIEGAAVGSLHPLLSLPWPRLDRRAFCGVYFGIHGDPDAARLARRLVRDSGGKFLELTGEDKALYHLAACLSSGYLLCLIDAASTTLGKGAVSPARFRTALLALAESTLENAKRAGLEAALTGPIPRGDALTVREHLKSLENLPGTWKVLHRTLARHSLEVAVRSRRVSPTLAARVGRLLREKG